MLMINFAMYIYLFTYVLILQWKHTSKHNDHMTVKCACARVTQHIYAAEFAVCIFKVLIMREVEAILYISFAIIILLVLSTENRLKLIQLRLEKQI
jgi:hypothetical protein